MATGTVPAIAAAMRAALGDLTDEQRRIAVALYRLLADGDRVTVAQVAARAGVDPAGVQGFLDTSPGVYRDDDGAVIGFWGLAIPEMPHAFQAEGGEPIHAWCAVDPFLIVPVIGRSARVTSVDPVTGEGVAMRVTPDGVDEVSPPGAVMSFVMPQKEFDHDVIQTFCHYVLNFASAASGQRWVDEHPETMLVSIEQAAEIGRLAWAPLIETAASVG